MIAMTELAHKCNARNESYIIHILDKYHPQRRKKADGMAPRFLHLQRVDTPFNAIWQLSTKMNKICL
jgi:hypothetical protein